MGADRCDRHEMPVTLSLALRQCGGDAVEQATAAPILLLAPVTRAILFPVMASSVGRRTHSQDVDH